MAIPRLSLNPLVVAAVVVVIFGISISAVQAKPMSPAPAPAPAPGHSSSDGTNLDQGIAYSLMGLALLLTYLIHSADIPDF